MGVDAGAPQSYWIWYAENQIAQDYGKRVSVQRKSKALNKFGRTVNADTDVKTTVAAFQGSVVNETFVSTNIIDSVVSDSASDTEVISVEGHTIDASGNLTFVAQQVTLTGTTPVALPTPLARCTRLRVVAGTFAAPASDLVGNVYAYDNTDGETLGVPNTAAATKCMINAGQNTSQKCATSLSSVDYWILTSCYAGMHRSGAAAAAVDIEIEVRQLGGVWIPLGLHLDISTGAQPWKEVLFEPYRVIPANSDVRMVCTASADNQEVSGQISGLLAIELPRR